MPCVLHHQSMLSCIVMSEQDLLKHSPYKHAKCAKLIIFPPGGTGKGGWRRTCGSGHLKASVLLLSSDCFHSCHVLHLIFSLPVLKSNSCKIEVGLHAGWNGNQVVGGLLLHTTRNTVTKSCDHRFSKYLTQCTDDTVIYDASTGDVVVLATTTGGLLPYGVDAVFLESSSAYDSSLSVGTCP